MSKIICDICGTSYPETAKQCPICGCVRPGDVQRVTNEVTTEGDVSTGYTHVKGGRFSKTNVKRRSGKKPAAPAAKPVKEKREKESDSTTARGLVITAIVLLLAIIGIVIYIAIQFFGPISNPVDPNNTTGITTTPTQIDLSCKELTVDVSAITLEKLGDGYLLSVNKQPENTSDVVTFTSENPAVATVSDAGNIVAVGEGTTKIIIKCGNVVKECVVVCQNVTAPTTTPTTAPTKPTTVPTTAPTKPAESISLNRKDITFFYKGETWILYTGTVAKNLVTWSSDNEAIVTFVDGKATAIGPGTTYIHAQYEDQKVSCIIRCNFKEEVGVGGNGGVTEDGGDATTPTTTPSIDPTTDPTATTDPSTTVPTATTDPSTTDPTATTDPTTETTQPTVPLTYRVCNQWGDTTNDITIRVGDSVGLYLRDQYGTYVKVEWQVNGKSCTSTDGVVTGVASGNSTVVATYNGNTYLCIVRVI